MFLRFETFVSADSTLPWATILVVFILILHSYVEQRSLMHVDYWQSLLIL